MNTHRKSIVVTGGASGIGLGMTRSFASQAHHITILDINLAAGTALTNSLATEFPKASFAFKQCDISSWDSQASVFAEIYSEQGRIDVVMANAGISQEAKLIVDEDVPQKPNLKTLDVNLIGTIYTVKLAIHYLRKNNPSPTSSSSQSSTSSSSNPPPTSRGSIICTASNAGVYAFPVAPIYAATKAGVINLVRSLARPLSAHAVQINALAPAVLETNIAPSKDLFKGMILTPMSTLTRGVDMLVGDANLTGQIAEIHGESVTLTQPPRYVDEDSETNIEHFWSLGYA